MVRNRTMANRLQRQLNRIERTLERLDRRMYRMGKEMDDLKAAVTAQTSVISSVTTLLGDLKTRLDAAIADDDPAAIKAISDEIGANTANLASAVTANTPASGQPTTPVVDTP